MPSYEFERIHGESNLNTFRDGFRVLRALLTERLRPAAPVQVPARRPLAGAAVVEVSLPHVVVLPDVPTDVPTGAAPAVAG